MLYLALLTRLVNWAFKDGYTLVYRYIFVVQDSAQAALRYKDKSWFHISSSGTGKDGFTFSPVGLGYHLVIGKNG